MWYLFWYIPWHKKKIPTCCGREIDVSCSHGAVYACKASCKSCRKPCCTSVDDDDNDKDDNHDDDGNGDHHDDDDDEEVGSITSSSNPCLSCCPQSCQSNNGRCSMRKQFVAYWQQRPSLLPSPSASHQSHNHHHHHPNSDNHEHEEYEGFDINLVSQGQEQHKQQGISHPIGRRQNHEDEVNHSPVIKHHKAANASIGSPKGTFV